jgi:hypothetical protein
MDAMEDIPMLLGNTGVKQELLLEICTMLPAGANPMLLLHVIITLLELLNLALLPLIPQNVKKNANQDGKTLMKMIKLLDNLDTDFITM